MAEYMTAQVKAITEAWEADGKPTSLELYAMIWIKLHAEEFRHTFHLAKTGRTA